MDASFSPYGEHNRKAKKALGQRLSEWRHKVGMHREDLAESIGVGVSYIKNVESGTFAGMSRARLEDFVLSIPGADLKEALKLWANIPNPVTGLDRRGQKVA